MKVSELYENYYWGSGVIPSKEEAITELQKRLRIPIDSNTTSEEMLKGMLSYYKSQIDGQWNKFEVTASFGWTKVDAKRSRDLMKFLINAARIIGYDLPEFKTIEKSLNSIETTDVSSVKSKEAINALKKLKKLGYDGPELQALEKFIKNKK